MAKIIKKQKPAISETLWSKLTTMAIRQYEDGVKFKQPRMVEIQQNEDLYNNKVKKAPKGRYNVPLPVMGGFVDTLMSKIDDAPSIEFEYTNLADYDKSLKITAAWKKDSSASTGRWGAKDRAAKRTACTAGMGIFEIYAQSDPEYQNNLSITDPIDFYCEALGGNWLENHKYLGKDNVFRSEFDLDEGVKAGIYDADKVASLKGSGGNNDQKRIRELYQNRQTRLRQLGLDPNNFNYTGQKMWSLVAHCMEYKGKRYYVVFDYDTGIAIRIQTIRDAFGYSPDDPELWPHVAWHTHPDELNFWSKAPADDIRPCADAINTLFNQALDNREKRNFNQRAVDGSIFPDLEQLEWRPDGLVQGDTKGGERRLAEGIYQFETPEINGTVDMINFMDAFIGTKTGITAAAQGGNDNAPSNDKVGIYYGNLQQVADRLGLYNKSYSDAWTQLGVRYVIGIKNHMTEEYMVKIIGENGAESVELSREDANPDEGFSIKPVGGQAEVRANENKKQTRIAALDKIMLNPTLAVKINPTWVNEQYLKAADFSDDEIQTAKDLTSDGDIYSLAEASKAIQIMLKGKKAPIYRSATTTFIQRILNYATDKVADEKIFSLMIGYAESHIPVAMENMQRKLLLSKPADPNAIDPNANPTAQTETKPTPDITETPVPNTPAGTASRSAKESVIAGIQ